jgi:hypothetical protein
MNELQDDELEVFEETEPVEDFPKAPLNELFAALAKAQGHIKGAIKDNANPFFKGKYADLASVWEACPEALSQNGLSVIQTTSPGDTETVTVYTTLGHSSGQRITGGLTMKTVKADPQGGRLPGALLRCDIQCV